MYSPKIREDLVPRIYRAAKVAKLPMTTWINRVVEQSLSEAASPETTKPERTVMNDQLHDETFVIARSGDGFRVCSPLTPGNQFVVTGIPDDPHCTCPYFNDARRDPSFTCVHVDAVLRESARNGKPPSTAAAAEPPPIPPAAEKKVGNRKNGHGAVMTLKRSISPDGHIDSLSVEFSCPLDKATTEEIKDRATKMLALQGDIAAGFLKASARPVVPANGNGNGSKMPTNGNDAPEGTPGQMLAVGSMPGRFGPRMFINFMVNGQVLKLFGVRDQLAEAVKAAGFANLADQVADGFNLNLPCRVITKPSANGKYTNIERVLPAQSAVPAGV